MYYKILLFCYRVYWFLFRPETAGAKCVVSCGGEVLMIRNNYGKRRWTFAGGRIEKGEASEHAARREVKEEVGIELVSIRPIGTLVSTEEYKKDTIYCFAGDAPNKNIVIQESEILEARWFLPEHLPQPLSPIAQKMIDFWKASR